MRDAADALGIEAQTVVQHGSLWVVLMQRVHTLQGLRDRHASRDHSRLGNRVLKM